MKNHGGRCGRLDGDGEGREGRADGDQSFVEHEKEEGDISNKSGVAEQKRKEEEEVEKAQLTPRSRRPHRRPWVTEKAVHESVLSPSSLKSPSMFSVNSTFASPASFLMLQV